MLVEGYRFVFLIDRDFPPFFGSSGVPTCTTYSLTRITRRRLFLVFPIHKSVLQAFVIFPDRFVSRFFAFVQFPFAWRFVFRFLAYNFHFRLF